MAGLIAGFPEDLALVGVIAEATGLAEEVIIAILEGSAEISVDDFISELCTKMGACD